MSWRRRAVLRQPRRGRCRRNIRLSDATRRLRTSANSASIACSRLPTSAKAALVEEGFAPAFRARPLRRTIQRRVENELTRRVLAGEFADGDAVIVGRDEAGAEYTFTAERAHEEVAV